MVFVEYAPLGVEDVTRTVISYHISWCCQDFAIIPQFHCQKSSSITIVFPIFFILLIHLSVKLGFYFSNFWFNRQFRVDGLAPVLLSEPSILKYDYVIVWLFVVGTYEESTCDKSLISCILLEEAFFCEPFTRLFVCMILFQILCFIRWIGNKINQFTWFLCN